MVIHDRQKLHSVEAKGDNLIFTHVKDVSASLQQAAHVRMFSDNGWTKEREMRQIGCIDAQAYDSLVQKHPDVLRNPSLLKEWLHTEEGRCWRTVDKIDSGRSGHIIVK